MFIQTEDTPNPATLKFLPGRSVMASGTAEFRNVVEAAASPLARRLLSIEGIEGVFFGSDFVSVTKRDGRDWIMLKPHVLGAIMEHYMVGGPAVENAAETAEAAESDPIILQIRELIETRVRPAVAQDGGDITFVRFDDGVVYLRMQGACAGCPSSTMTLKSGIETMLKHYVPEVRAVEQADSL
jgi:Fe-S cluster biogenesis protein NfuA